MLSDFLVHWFGYQHRSLGIPQQSLIHDSADILPHMDQKSYPVYLSVNPYDADYHIYSIEKLYFDFDHPTNPALAFQDCASFANKLWRRWKIESLIIRSGHKGYNCYVWLKKRFVGKQAEMKQKYTTLQNYLIHGETYPTLDRHVIGDYKRIARIPYSYHQVTGNLVVPVNVDGYQFELPYDFIDFYMSHGIDGDMVIYEEPPLPARLTYTPITANQTKTMDIRPCMQAVLDSASVHDPPHILKVCLVSELHEKGYTENAIVAFFSRMSGFNDAITRHQIRTIIGHYKPFRCETIKGYGGCVGASCRFYRLELNDLSCHRHEQ